MINIKNHGLFRPLILTSLYVETEEINGVLFSLFPGSAHQAHHVQGIQNTLYTLTGNPKSSK